MQNPDSQIVTDSVWHELAFGLENLGIEQSKIRLRVAETASYFGIEHIFHKDITSLSGGEKQLVNLAAVMAMNPSALVLDEPTSQLDPIAAQNFLQAIRKLNYELGITIIIVEHRLQDIFSDADRVVVLEAGKIVIDDTPVKVGEILNKTNSDMLYALPAPLRVYYGTGKSGVSPLTVRAGREWLEADYGDKKQLQQEPSAKVEIKTKAAVELKEIYFRYDKNGKDVLKGVNLTVKSGEFLAILGGNGAGKSTLLGAISGENKIYSGKVLVDGKDIKSYKNGALFSNKLAMLPQSPMDIFAHKTVAEDLAEMVSGANSKEDNEKAIARVCETTQIKELTHRHPFDLSGGEQQRAAIAKVLLANPEILILDEPTKGIDEFFKKQLAELILTLKAQGVTVIMVSHDVEFCAEYPDRVALFFDGEIITSDTPKEFFSNNNYYTTQASRMSRGVFDGLVTTKDLIERCRENQNKD